MKKYIHERAAWPETKLDKGLLSAPLVQLHHTLGRLFGKLEILGFGVQNELLLSSVSDEIATSSEIEGEKLNRSSIRSSVAKRLGLETAGMADGATDHYTAGVVDMALDATQNYDLPITDERLFGWQAALFLTGRSGMRPIRVGAYRTAEISIVSGVIGKEIEHYRAPEAKRVPEEMKRFIDWLETDKDTDPYINAGIAQIDPSV